MLIADFFFILFSLGWLGVGLAERSALQSTVRGVGEGGKGGGRRVWYAGKGVCVESSAAAECIAAQRSTAHSEESAPSGGAPLPRAFGGFVAGGVTITERGPSGSSSLPPPGGPLPPPPPPPPSAAAAAAALAGHLALPLAVGLPAGAWRAHARGGEQQECVWCVSRGVGVGGGSGGGCSGSHGGGLQSPTSEFHGEHL